MYGHYRPIVVRAKPARPLNLLGRAEPSSSNAALRRAEGAEFDGESADRATIKVTAMRVVVGHCPRERVPDSTPYSGTDTFPQWSFLRDASAPECLADRPYCLGSTVDSDQSEGVDSTRRKSPSMLDIGVGL